VERGQHQAGHRLEVLLGQAPVERLVQLVDVGAGGHPVAAVGQPLDGGGRAVVLVLDLADDLLDDVLERDDPGGAAVLVHHDRELAAPLLHLAQQVVDALGLRHEVRLAHELRDLGHLAAAAQQVHRRHHAHHVRLALAVGRDP
jgi:hypothetical protein